MSYCVNCGVELDASAKECPLCNTPVLNPRELEKMMQGHGPFPQEMGQVETVKRKDVGIFITILLLATAITCGGLDILTFTGVNWSLAVIGVCVVIWVILIPVMIYQNLSVYLSLLFDGVAVAGYLYMLTFLTGGSGWFWDLGLPIAVWVTVVAELLTLCIRKLPKSFLTEALYLTSGLGVLCLGLEILIDLHLTDAVKLRWSAVVLTVCIILDIAVITMLSMKRLRNAVRKRLHF